MSSEIEDLVRDSLDGFTADVPVPAGLGVRAYQRYRRRRNALRATGGAAAAIIAAGSLAVAALASAGRAAPPVGVPAHDAAYIIRQADQALTQSQSSRVEFLRESWYQPGGKAAVIVKEWTYRDRTRVLSYSDDGALESDVWSASAHGTVTVMAVDYVARSWSRTTQPAEAALPDDCSIGRAGINRPIAVQQLLACGTFVITGHDDIGGVKTVKLTEVRAGDRPVITAWVDQSTYLLIRLTGSRHGVPVAQLDFRWLAPALATVNMLSVPPVPAGFRQVPGGP